MEEEKLLSIQEAADLLGVSTKTLRRWEAKGILNAKRTVGMHRRYTAKQITDFSNQLSNSGINELITDDQTTDATLLTEDEHEQSTELPPVAAEPESHRFSFPIKRLLFSGLGAAIAGLVMLTTVLFVTANQGLQSSLDNVGSMISQINPAFGGNEKNNQASVLAGKKYAPNFKFTVNVPALFKNDVTLSKDLFVEGLATISGQLTAPNIIYSVRAGNGISVSSGQNPLITNTDPGSEQAIFKTVKVGSTSLLAGTNTDTLELAAGDGISLSADTGGKKVTITSTVTTPSSAGIAGVIVQLDDIDVTDEADTFDFMGGDFDVGESPGGEVNIQLADILTSVTGIAGNFDINGTLSAGTGNAFQVSSAGTISIPAGQSLSIGGIELNDVGTDNLTAGASLIGVFDELSNSNGTTLQDVLDDLDAAIGGGSSKWTQGTGLVYLTNTTDNVFIGGTDATNARFGFMNVASGTPTASVSAGTSGAFYFTADGKLATTAKQSITLGDINTGSIIFNGGNVGIGTNSPTSLFTVNGTTTGKALTLFNETGDQDILTASASGITALSLARSGSLTLYSTTATSDRLLFVPQSGGVASFTGTITTSDLTADRQYTLPNEGGTICLTTGNCAGLGGNGDITGVGSMVDGDVFSDNTADDDWLGLGSGAGRIEFDDQTVDEVNILMAKLGLGTQTPDGLLHVTGAIPGKALTIFNETGDQNIITASASGTTRLNLDRSGNLNIIGGAYQISGTSVLSSNTLGAGVTASSLTSVGTLTSGTWNATAIGAQYGGTGINTSAATGVATVNGGTWSITAALSTVLGGTGDDTSSTTGVPFISSGNWQYEAALDETRGGTGLAAYNQGDILYASGSNTLATLGIGGSNTCLTSNGTTPSWVGCSTQYWQLNAGAISPFSNTADLLLGGTATTSAKFGFINVNSGTPTASISAGTAGGTYLTATGTLQTTADQLLTLGGNSTGNILLNDQTAIGNGSTGIQITTTGVLSDIDGTIVEVNDDLQVTGNDLLDSSSTSRISLGATNTLTNTGLTLSGTTGITASALTSLSAAALSINTTGDLTLDSTTDIILDADGADVLFKDNGTTFASFTNSTTDLTLDIAGNNLIFADADTIALGGNSGAAYNAIAAVLSNVDIADDDADLFIGDELEVNGAVRFDSATITLGNGAFANCGSLGTSGNAITCSSISATQNYWQLNNGALSPFSNTTDVLFGGTATASAKFAFINVNSGTPTASISAGTNGGIYMTADGTIATTAQQNITLGGSTVGTISLDPGVGNLVFGGGSSDTILANASTWTFANDTNFVLSGGANGLSFDTSTLSIDANSDRVGIGTIAPDGKLTVSGRVTGKALTVFNETGDQNIITASASGITVANLERGGNLFIEGAIGDLSDGTLVVADDLQINSDDLTTNQTTFNLINTTATTLNFGSAATVLNIADAAITGTIDIGGVTADGVSTINIATNGTSADAIAIGNAHASTTLSLVGGDDWSITTTGVGTFTQANVDNLRMDGNTFSATSGDITIDATDGNIIFADNDTLNIGGAAAAAFNFFAGATTNNTSADGDNDLYIEDELEVDGAVRFDNSSITLGNAAFSSCGSLGTSSGAITCNSVSATQNYWQLNNGALSPFAVTADINLGATATSSAKISLAGSLTRGKAVTIFNQTEAQDIIAASASGTTKLRVDASGNVYSSGAFFPGNSVQQTTRSFGDDGSTLTASALKVSGTLNLNGQLTTNVVGFQANNGDIINFKENAGAHNTFVFNTLSGKLWIGGGTIDGTPSHVLDVNGSAAGKAMALLNYSGTDQNILTASSSGVTRFTLGNAGDITQTTANGTDLYNLLTGSFKVGNASPTNTLDGEDGFIEGGLEVDGAVRFDNSSITLGNAAFTTCGSLGTSSGAVTCNSVAATQNLWQLNSGALSPFSITADLNLGATATSSAKISLAGSLTRGLAAAIINQTESQDIFTASASGATKFVVENDGDIRQQGADGTGYQVRNTTTNNTERVLGTANSGIDLHIGSDWSGNATSGSLYLGYNMDATARGIYIGDGSTKTDVTLGQDLTVSGGDITGVAGESIDLGEATADTLSFTTGASLELLLNGTNLTPGTAEGNSLGSATSEWEQVFVGDNNGVSFGLDQDWTLGYDEATDDRLELVTSGTSGMLIQSATQTGNALALAADALTSGKALDISTASTGLTSGSLLNVSSTANFTAFTGNLANVEWSPSSATTATGDLFRIKLGANGNIGNLFNILDDTSSLFSVTESQITSALPHQFTAAGDVNIAYDLQFTNQTGSYIKSNAPLYLEAGESFESNDLVLRTFNGGVINLDAGLTGGVMVGTAAQVGRFHVDGAQMGKALVVLNETGNQAILSASASGTTVFTMARDGGVTISGAPTTAFNITSTSVTTDISLQNGETIDNNTNGDIDLGGEVIINLDGTAVTTEALCGNQADGDIADTNNIRISDCSGAPTADYAEMYPTEEEADYGDVMVLSDEIVQTWEDDGKGHILKDQPRKNIARLVRNTNPYDNRVIGIVSNNYSDFTSTGHGLIDEADNPKPIALNGRVPVKIASDSQPIRIGDFLTTSTQTGRAMKATRSGQVIGKALESWTPGSGQEKIMVFVNIVWYDPTISITSTGNISFFQDPANPAAPFTATDIVTGESFDKVSIFSDAAIANLSAGAIDAKQILLNGIDILDILKNVSASSESAQTVASDSAVLGLENRVSTAEGRIDLLESLSSSIASTAAQAASDAAFVKSIVESPIFNASPSATLDAAIENLEIETATVSGTLNVLGRTVLNDVGITGNLTAGVMSIHGLDGEINTLGAPLKLQPFGVEAVEIMAGKVVINTDGNITTSGEITAKKINIDTADDTTASAGEGMIAAGSRQLTIPTEAITASSLIYVTFSDDYTPATRYWIESKVVGTSFTVKLDKNVANNTNFNWWIVN